MVVGERQAQLLEVILALGLSSGFSRLLHGRQQQCNEYGNDRNDHEQLDQREAAMVRHLWFPTFGQFDDHDHLLIGKQCKKIGAGTPVRWSDTLDLSVKLR